MGVTGSAAVQLLALLLVCSGVQPLIVAAEILEVAAVPGPVGAQFQQSAAGGSAAPGAYQNSLFSYGSGDAAPGGYGRSLLQVPGGYGYGFSAAAGYGRLLVEGGEDASYDQQPAAQQPLLLQYAPAAAPSRRSASLSIPAGQCYCQFDPDFNTFALAEDTCREALYTRCKAEAGLPCSWLDALYAPAKGPGHTLPHEAAVQAFVYEDCSPNPPCGCAAARFDGTDSAPVARACCRDLRVACKTPFSGVQCQNVEAFCTDDTPSPVLAAWTKHMLHHSDCSSYRGLPYQFVSLHALQTTTQVLPALAQQEPAATAPAEAVLLREALQHDLSTAGSLSASSTSESRLVIVLLAAVAAGAVCVAVVAVVFALQQQERDDDDDDAGAAGAAPITSDAVLPRQQQQLREPQPAACVGGSMHHDGSAAADSSRVIWIGRRSNSSEDRSGVREPLLRQPA